MLKVIGAGLGRTGTRSLKDALQALGVGPAYHMTDLFEHPEGIVHWEDAAEGRPTDWEALFEGYQSVVDYPGALYWRELMALYPDAKVVLTVRDPEAWVDSVLATIYPSSDRDRSESRLFRMINKAIWQGSFEGRFTDRDYALAHFEAHSAAVIEEVPAERLLVYQISQGWEPLARFLGVEVPQLPFPNRNSRAEFTARLRQD